MNQYNKIYKQYTESNLFSILRKYSEEPSFKKHIGNVKGLKILDIACGNGNYTRSLKKLGAKKIIGIDISEKMLELAKESEHKKPLGIHYLKFDALNLPKIDNFDIVTAFWLLHYAKTKNILEKFCKNIYDNLKKDGRFFTILPNPKNPDLDSKKYGIKIKTKNLNQDGSLRTITYFDNQGKEFCFFNNYHWKKRTYENALKNAGFKKIKWLKPTISPAGIKKIGKEFWKDKIYFTIIECYK